MRILLVEDDLSIADFICRGLREDGYEVVHVADGEAAQEKLRAERWAVVVLDCWLPKADGLTVLRRFRQQGGDAPVMMLTARDAVADRVAGLDGGADDYLCKPFAFAELLARIRSLSRRNENKAQTSPVYADVSIDLAAQRAERNYKLLDLKTKELQLLAFFVRNSERTLTREELYQNVWNESYDGLSNTLEVHIKDLRRKLEEFGPRLIHTIRGSGYIMSASALSKEASS